LKLDNYPPHFAFEDYILYFGRLAKEKGVLTLLKAMKKAKEVKLRVVGEGPERAELEEYASQHNLANVRFDGVKGGDELKSLVGNSRFVVVPSEWYDNSPLVIYESSALGKPVIGARIGGIPELIEDNRTGFHFEAGNADELADKITHLDSRPERISEFGRQARVMAEREFEPERHYERIHSWYRELVGA
jgi:glycosyltransferase involved in cell wall biosynthesis